MLKYTVVMVISLLILVSPSYANNVPKDEKSCMVLLGWLDPILDSQKIPKETAKSLFVQLEGVSSQCQSGKFSEAVSSIESLKATLGKLEDK